VGDGIGSTSSTSSEVGFTLIFSSQFSTVLNERRLEIGAGSPAGDAYTPPMSKQTLGNALAGVVFLGIAIFNFTDESSGAGAVFLVFAAVYLGLAFSGRRASSSP
jgi:hypothetical protein